MTKLNPQTLPFAPGRPVTKVGMFLVHEGNLILIVRHHKDNSVSIEPPGGKVDPRKNGILETHSQAIKREMFQEIGVLCKPAEKAMSFEKHPYTGQRIDNYLCHHVAGTPWNKASTEHLDIIKIPLWDVTSYDDLEAKAIKAAQEVVQRTLKGAQLSRPIDFRLSEETYNAFCLNLAPESVAELSKISEKKWDVEPMPA